jgi:hypothetical protein
VTGATSHLPLFPLNTVTFPGLTLPLHIFEDRYRQMLADVAKHEGPDRMCFTVTAIREGYEVGDTGVKSLYQIGAIVQVSQITWHPDGGADISVNALSRVRITETHQEHAYLTADVEPLPDEAAGPDAHRLMDRALELFADYRLALFRMRGDEPLVTDLPRDPGLLSYLLAASTLIPVRQRQNMLESPGPEDRLRQLVTSLSSEISAMRAIPSLPATEVNRTGWSPN